MNRARTFVPLAAIALASFAQAEDHRVVPHAFESIPGTGTFNGPMDGVTARTYQWLIHADQLTPFVGRTLNGISFRLGPSTVPFPAAEISVPSFDLYLGQSVAPNARSITNFSANHVGPLTQVRSGSLVIPMNAYPAGGVEFGPTISFTNYVYLSGHLLIEMRKSAHTGATAPSSAIMASTGAVHGYGTQFSACWGGGTVATAGSQGNFIIARLHAVPLPTYPITGSIAFSDYIAPLEGKTVQMTFTNAGSTTSVHSATVTVNAAGEYTYLVPQTLPLGNYDLYSDRSPFLKRKQSVVLTDAGATGINFILPNGDCDNSGEVDAADVDTVIAAFGATLGGSGYSPSVDCDGSEEVDAADIDIVISSFGALDD